MAPLLCLALVWLSLEAAPIRARPLGGKPTYRVHLHPDRREYQLVSPGPGSYVVLIEGANPSGKTKLVFLAPLQPGSYALTVRPLLVSDVDQTFVFSVPLETGDSSFVVSASGKARYDFAFQLASKKEYRYTFTAPVNQKTFHLAP
jgi:hypothetical protein